jgi:hypothetical protein
LTLGTLDAGQNLLTACVTATIPALAEAATLSLAVTVTALSHDNQAVVPDGVTAQIQPNDPELPERKLCITYDNTCYAQCGNLSRRFGVDHQ